MLFSELYSAYYNAVAAILKQALSAPVSDQTVSRISRENAFGESFITIKESLKNGSWPLLNGNGTAVVKNPPEMPLTVLQKRWLKAIALDPRIRLFGAVLPDFPGVEPLFRPEDVCVFDRYSDGDDYGDENYIRHFRLILDAIKNRYPLKINILNRFDRTTYLTAQPEYLEYSEKDDKFRLITSGCRYGGIINVGRILSCRRSDSIPSARPSGAATKKEKIVMEVTDDRNALERVLLHFAHFAKEAERIDEKRYRVTVEYDADDETEMEIRILSFGPLVRVTEPEKFVDLIKKRLKKQKNLEKSCE